MPVKRIEGVLLLPTFITMKKIMLLLLPACFLLPSLQAQPSSPDSVLPVRGFCIAAPAPKDVDRFIKFIDEELATRKVNTLILRVDYGY